MPDTTRDATTVSREIEASAARAPGLEVDEGYPLGGLTAGSTGSALHGSAALSWSRVVRRMDRAVALLLRVQPQPLVLREAVATTSSWPFETPLLVSAVRCILRYVVLPFVLPVLGVATGAALGILLTVDVIAAIAIVAALRQLWRLQHPRRWQYLAVALALAVLVGLFFMGDTRVLFV
jgi:hypothetical protein